jgi:threonine/homoserine/homoserine lactone efflux protein
VTVLSAGGQRTGARLPRAGMLQRRAETARVTAWLGSIALLAFVMAATPGPNNVLFAAAGARAGYRRTLPLLAGMIGGFVVLIGAVLVGVGGLLDAVPGSRVGMSTVASAYMVYLGVRLWSADPLPDEPGDDRTLMAWWQMALFQVANPKTWLAVLAFVTGKLGPHSPGGVAADLVGAACFLMVVWGSASAWALFGAALRAHLAADGGQRVMRAMAVLAVLTVITFWW